MADPVEIPEDVKSLSFEQALAELEEIVRDLESGAVDLEKSIAIYTRGTQLKAHCEAKLKDAQARVDRIVVGAEGRAEGSEPADIE